MPEFVLYKIVSSLVLDETLHLLIRLKLYPLWGTHRDFRFEMRNFKWEHDGFSASEQYYI